MKYKILLQTGIILSWVFLAASINLKFFPSDIFLEAIMLICFASMGLAISLAIPFLWEKQKGSGKN